MRNGCVQQVCLARLKSPDTHERGDTTTASHMHCPQEGLHGRLSAQAKDKYELLLRRSRVAGRDQAAGRVYTQFMQDICTQDICKSALAVSRSQALQHSARQQET